MRRGGFQWRQDLCRWPLGPSFLFGSYGLFYVQEIALGGRLNISYTTDSTQTVTSYALKAACKVKASGGAASASAEGAYEQSEQSALGKSVVNKRVSSEGGQLDKWKWDNFIALSSMFCFFPESSPSWVLA